MTPITEPIKTPIKQKTYYLNQTQFVSHKFGEAVNVEQNSD